VLCYLVVVVEISVSGVGDPITLVDLVKSRVIDSTGFCARTLVMIDSAFVRPHAVFLAIAESGKINRVPFCTSVSCCAVQHVMLDS